MPLLKEDGSGRLLLESGGYLLLESDAPWLFPRRPQRQSEDPPPPLGRRRFFPITPSLWFHQRPQPRLLDQFEPVPARRNTISHTLTYLPFGQSGRGLYRVFNAAGYRFYRSNIAPPQPTDTPFDFSPTLPYTPSATYADGTWYVSVSYFDGVLDSGFLPVGPHGETYLTLEISGGNPVGTRPSQPSGASLAVLAGGVIQINAYYSGAADGANAATQWSIAYTTDGSTPASGSPTLTPAITGASSAMSILSYKLPAQADGTVVKVQLQTRRQLSPGVYLYSLPAAVLTATADASGPSGPLGFVAWPGSPPGGEGT